MRIDGLAEICLWISQCWLRVPVFCNVFKRGSVLQAPRCVPTHQASCYAAVEEDGTDISPGIWVHLSIAASGADAASPGLGPWRACVVITT